MALHDVLVTCYLSHLRNWKMTWWKNCIEKHVPSEEDIIRVEKGSHLGNFMYRMREVNNGSTTSLVEVTKENASFV